MIIKRWAETFLKMLSLSEKKLLETTSTHRNYANVIASNILTTIVIQYEEYAENSDYPLDDEEKTIY